MRRCRASSVEQSPALTSDIREEFSASQRRRKVSTRVEVLMFMDMSAMPDIREDSFKAKLLHVSEALIQV